MKIDLANTVVEMKEKARKEEEERAARLGTSGVFKENNQSGLEIDMVVFRESLKHPNRKPDETFKEYKARMSETKRAEKHILRGKLFYNSNSMKPYSVE